MKISMNSGLYMLTYIYADNDDYTEKVKERKNERMSERKNLLNSIPFTNRNRTKERKNKSFLF